MNLSAALVVEVPPGVVIVMSTAPSEPAGGETVSDVAELTVTLVPGCPAPKLTLVPPVTKPVPVRVTAIPPVAGPAPGATAVTTGTGS